MPLSWNEIRTRAISFVKEWEGEQRERAEKDSFWNDFFHVFGISRRRVASFEEPVKKLSGHYGFIDLFWKGKILIEHKSKGKDLDKAYSQALEYFEGLKERELPQYVLVSDFDRFKLHNLESGEQFEFALNQFVDHIKLFGFIAGWEQREFQEEAPVNIEAAEKMGKLHDRLKEIGYEGKQLEIYLVRLLFCLFADDTGIFSKGIFQEYIDLHTKVDGSDLAMHLSQIFQTLDTPADKRLTNINESLNDFPYVNGSLFADRLMIPTFDSSMREILLDAGSMDWGEISPAIFGSMFQAALDPVARRNFGAHYTSEKNIMKVIKPLFLDDLWVEFHKIKSPAKLQAFHTKIAKLKFLDPACGSGNFLIITYRELRLLELEILRKQRTSMQGVLDVRMLLQVTINNFYGIEIDEFAAKVAEVGMWLIEHQMNEKVSMEFGQNVINLPLKESANIVNANALRVDWQQVISKSELNYILGNPPFLGKQYQSKEQKADMSTIFGKVKGAGVLDFVCAWYALACQYIQDTQIEVAFVSTNSISQGEQTGVLWGYLFSNFEIKINFAHRTFQWNNKAKGKAAVHCVIISFGTDSKDKKLLFEYDDIKGDPQELSVRNINPYLVDGPDITIPKRSKPICDVPLMTYGNMPNDGGNLVFDTDRKNELIALDKRCERYIKKFVMGEELINNIDRWALWINEHDLADIRNIKPIMEVLDMVKSKRLASSRAATNKLAQVPYRFGEVRQPDQKYIALPRVSSMRRDYIPIAILNNEIIAGDKVYTINQENHFYLGVLQSKMHMSWMKYTAGRMKSDYSYTNQITYNNYPFPKNPSQKQIDKVEQCAKAVLEARVQFPESSLADLYDPLAMPPTLVKAHNALDKAVDQCYRKATFANERTRIEYLFELYEAYTAPLIAKVPSSKKKKK